MVLIFVSGEIKISASKKAIEEVLQIKYEQGDEVFEEGCGVLTFRNEEMEGSDPIEDYVVKPLKELVAIARKRRFKIEGSIEISSEWRDYNNVTIEIKDRSYSIYNTVLMNVSTEELLGELKRRGIHVPEDKKGKTSRSKKQYWIVGVCNTSGDGVDLTRVHGTPRQVDRYLLRRLKEDKREDPDRFEYGDDELSEIVVDKYRGCRDASATYSNYHIDYTAIPEGEPIELS